MPVFDKEADVRPAGSEAPTHLRCMRLDGCRSDGKQGREDPDFRQGEGSHELYDET